LLRYRGSLWLVSGDDVITCGDPIFTSGGSILYGWLIGGRMSRLSYILLSMVAPRNWQCRIVGCIRRVGQARFPFKCTQALALCAMRALHENRIDSIVAFSCARTACFSCMTCACVLLFFACIIFLRSLRFLRTFYFACVLFLMQGLACVSMETGL